MFGWKKKPRLSKVIVRLRHGASPGRDVPDIVDEIELEHDETFVIEIGSYRIYRSGLLKRTIEYRAGYTEDIEYIY